MISVSPEGRRGTGLELWRNIGSSVSPLPRGMLGPERTLPTGPHLGPYPLLTGLHRTLDLTGGWGPSRELQCWCLPVGRVFLKLVLSMTLPTVCRKEQKAPPFSGPAQGGGGCCIPDLHPSLGPRCLPPLVTGLTPAPGRS